MITTDQLKKICTSLKIDRAATLAALLNKMCDEFKPSVQAFKFLLANICEESGEFSIKKESMYYTTPERLIMIWPSRFSIDGKVRFKAEDYIKNERKLANVVYNGRMQNRPGTDDGFTFRGTGFLQLTGREDFSAYAKFINYTGTMESLADTIRDSDEHCIRSAFWEFFIYKNLGNEPSFKKCVLKINGGYTNMNERLRYLDLCEKNL